MNTPDTGSGAPAAEMTSALFAQMVLQQTNMALMLMGKIANPQSGETMHDLSGAKYFIDQLEMLTVKTQGNLTADEDKLLRQSLLTLRMTFVEASAAPVPEAKSAVGEKADEQNSTAAPGEDAAAAKRFTKKY